MRPDEAPKQRRSGGRGGGLSFVPRRAEGPVGTGVHLLRLTRGADGVVLADAWLTLAFLPVVPLGEWIVEREGSTRDPCVIRQVRPPRLRKSIPWIVCGGLAGLASLLPGYGALTFLMGSRGA